MEMLNTSTLLAKDLWTVLIDWFAKGITNYGWTIILFTICLKLVLSPLDVYQRVSTQKQSRFMSIMKPEQDEINRKYANDRQKLNIETNKLYKKYGVSMGGMCLSMFLTLGISLLVFFTLFSSLRSYGNDKLYSSFRELDKTCIEVVADKDIANLTETEKNEIEIEIKEKYKDLKDQNGWLWVKNVWKSDTKTSQFVSFKSYANHYDLKDEARDEAKVRYDLITESIEGEKSEPNGFYILIILAVLVSFATQFISTKLLAPKGQQMNMMNKIMMAVIPLSMIIFVLSSNVVFTLYIITNSIMSTLISTVITLIMRRKDKGIDDKDFIMQNKNINVVEYSRNYKK